MNTLPTTPTATANPLACLALALLSPCLATPGLNASTGSGPWTIETADTALAIAVTNNQPILQHLRTPASNHDWLSTGSTVPLLAKVWWADREIPTAWTFVGASLVRTDHEARLAPATGPRFGEPQPNRSAASSRQSPLLRPPRALRVNDPRSDSTSMQSARGAGPGTLTLTFTNAAPALLLRSIWRARPGHGPVEHWIEIVNDTAQRVTVSHQDSLSLAALRPGNPATVWWIKRGGSNASTQGGTFTQPLSPELDLTLVSNCEDGASPVPWLAVQVGASHGLYVGWEFSGLGRIQARALDAGAALGLAVGNLPEFRTDLEPGETFLVPPAFVGCYTGDLDDGSYTLHRWVIEKLRPPVPEGVPDPTLAYNLYLDAGGSKAREADVLRSAAFCRDLGFETFMPDAMWFPETGDWRWDPRRFPRGIGPIERFVHRQDMQLALWCAWSNGGVSEHPDALSVRGAVGRPEWFNADFAPDWKPGPFYGGQLCLGCLEAKAWAIRKTQWLVGHHRLDYLKHDIGPIVTRCNKSTHRHRYGVDASYWAAMGYYEVQERLRQAFPRLLLENCSGGGHIKDYGAMARTHYVVTTDTLSNLPDRQSLYDSTFALPPLVLQAYTYEREYKVPGDDPGPFLWRSAMMGAWQIDPTNTRLWTEDEQESARRAAATYKHWIRPLLQDVKVHHILPRPDGVHWDGLFHWSAPRRQGMLFIFRPDAPEAEQTVRLKGLEAHQHYRVWGEDASVGPAVWSGADLTERGLTVRLPDRYTSDLVYLQEASLPTPEGLSLPGKFRLRSVKSASQAFGASATLRWARSAGARSYRVTVAESPDFARTLVSKPTFGTTLALTDLPANRSLTWKVEAVGWGGRRVNEGGAATFTAPRAQDLSGLVFVSDLPWIEATAGAGNPVRRDTNYHGQPIRVAGRTRPKGVWTHAFPDATPADVAVGIASLGVTRFAADVGVESSAGNGSVQFGVLTDGVLRASSPVLRQGQSHRFRVDVTGVTEVRLRVLNGGDGYTCDHAAWGLARFVRAGAADPLEELE